MKRLISFLLCLSMVISMLPVSAFASETEELPSIPEPQAVEETAAPETTMPVTEPVPETESVPVVTETEAPAAPAETSEPAPEATEEMTTSAEAALQMAEEEPKYIVTEFTWVPDVEMPSEEERFAGYVNQEMYGAAPLGWVAGGQLDGDAWVAYNALVPVIYEIASGNRESTSITLGTPVDGHPVDVEAQFYGGEFTNDQLYSLLRALLNDLPFPLYWFDKTDPYGIHATMMQNEEKTQLLQLTVEFAVAKSYSKDKVQGTYYVDTAKTGAVLAALNTAKAIAVKYDSASDYEKLLGYKEEICALNTYNSAAADDKTTPYGDPWQMIYVFDGDPDTNVVCEGYSKAFQYLCDLSVFYADICCYSVTGKMGNGAHMWNIVTVNDKSYMVDVTNSEPGTPGSDGELFLRGGSGSVSSGYYFENWRFTYSEETLDVWGNAEDSILKLDTVSLTEETFPTPDSTSGALASSGNMTAQQLVTALEAVPEGNFYTLRHTVIVDSDVTLPVGKTLSVMDAGGKLVVKNGATLTVPTFLGGAAGGVITVEEGAALTLDGTMSIGEGGNVYVYGTLNHNAKLEIAGEVAVFGTYNKGENAYEQYIANGKLYLTEMDLLRKQLKDAAKEGEPFRMAEDLIITEDITINQELYVAEGVTLTVAEGVTLTLDGTDLPPYGDHMRIGGTMRVLSGGAVRQINGYGFGNFGSMLFESGTSFYQEKNCCLNNHGGTVTMPEDCVDMSGQGDMIQQWYDGYGAVTGYPAERIDYIIVPADLEELELALAAVDHTGDPHLNINTFGSFHIDRPFTLPEGASWFFNARNGEANKVTFDADLTNHGYITAREGVSFDMMNYGIANVGGQVDLLGCEISGGVMNWWTADRPMGDVSGVGRVFFRAKVKTMAELTSALNGWEEGIYEAGYINMVGDMVIDQDITLDKNLHLQAGYWESEDVIETAAVTLAEGVTLTVPTGSGLGLMNDSLLIVRGKLAVDNVLSFSEGSQVDNYGEVAISGKVLGDPNFADCGGIYSGSYFDGKDDTLLEAYPEDTSSLLNAIRDFRDGGYEEGFLYINTDMSIDEAVTLPGGMTMVIGYEEGWYGDDICVDVNDAAITLQEGAQIILSENVQLNLRDGASLTVEQGGQLHQITKAWVKGEILVHEGAELTVREGGLLRQYADAENESMLCSFGGDITVAEGTFVQEGEGNCAVSSRLIGSRFGKLQGFDKEQVFLYLEPTSMEQIYTTMAEMKTGLYGSCNIMILEDFTITSDMTLPERSDMVVMSMDGELVTLTIAEGVTVENYGNLVATSDTQIVVNGMVTGNGPIADGGEILGSFYEEMTVEKFRAWLNASENPQLTFTVNINEDFTLDKHLSIGEDGYLYTSDGVTLTVNESIWIHNGDLTINEEDTLVNNGNIEITGGYLYNYGTYVKGNDWAEISEASFDEFDEPMSIFGFDSQDITLVCSIWHAKDAEALIADFLSNLEGYGRGRIHIHGDYETYQEQNIVTLNGLTIPENVTLILENDNGSGPIQLLIPEGSTLDNQGHIRIGREGTLTVEGEFTGNLPELADLSARFEMGEDFSVEDLLRAQIAAGGDVHMAMPVTLTGDLEIPAGTILYLDNTGDLTVPENVTVTVKGEIHIHDGATLTVQKGAALKAVGGEESSGWIGVWESDLVMENGSVFHQEQCELYIAEGGTVTLKRGSKLEMEAAGFNLEGGTLNLETGYIAGAYNEQNYLMLEMNSDCVSTLNGKFTSGRTGLHTYPRNMDDIFAAQQKRKALGFDYLDIQIDDNCLDENGEFVIDQNLTLGQGEALMLTPADPEDPVEWYDVFLEHVTITLDKGTMVVGQNAPLHMLSGAGILVMDQGRLIQDTFRFAPCNFLPSIYVDTTSSVTVLAGGQLIQSGENFCRFVNEGGKVQLAEGTYVRETEEAGVYNFMIGDTFGTVTGVPAEYLTVSGAAANLDQIKKILEENDKGIYGRSEIGVIADMTIDEDLTIPGNMDLWTQPGYEETTTLVIAEDTVVANHGNMYAFENSTIQVDGIVTGNLPWENGGEITGKFFEEMNEEKFLVWLDASKDPCLNFEVEVCSDLILEKHLRIGEGGYLHMMDGTTLTVNGGIWIDGGDLTLEADTLLRNNSCIEITRGWLYTRGDYELGEYGELAVASYDEFPGDTSVSGFSEQDLTLVGSIQDPEEAESLIQEFITDSYNYGHGRLHIHGDFENHAQKNVVTLYGDVTIPEHVRMLICDDNNSGPIELVIAKGATLDNQGTIEISYQGALTIRGNMTGNLPKLVDGNTSFDPGSQMDAEAMLRDQLERTGEVWLSAPVTLTEDLEIPEGTRVFLCHGAKLTVPAGITLTVGGDLDLFRSSMTVYGEVAVPGGWLNVDWESAAVFPSGAALKLSDWGSLNIEKGATVTLASGAKLYQELGGMFVNGGTLNLAEGVCQGEYNPENTLWNYMADGYVGTINGSYTLGLTLLHGYAYSIEDIRSIFNAGGAYGYDDITVQVDDSCIDESGVFYIDEAIAIPANAGLLFAPADPGDERQCYEVVLDGAAITVKNNAILRLGQNVTMRLINGARIQVEKGGRLMQSLFDWAEFYEPNRIRIDKTSSLTVQSGGICRQDANTEIINEGGTVNVAGAYEADRDADVYGVVFNSLTYNTSGVPYFGTVTGIPKEHLVGYAEPASMADVRKVVEESGTDRYMTCDMLFKQDFTFTEDVTLNECTSIVVNEPNSENQVTVTIPEGVAIYNNGGAIFANPNGTLRVDGMIYGSSPWSNGGILTGSYFEMDAEKFLEWMDGSEDPWLMSKATLEGDVVLNRHLGMGDGGCVTVPAGATLTVNEGLWLDGAVLIVEEGATLINNSNIEVTRGEIRIYGDYVKGTDWAELANASHDEHEGEVVIEGVSEELITLVCRAWGLDAVYAYLDDFYGHEYGRGRLHMYGDQTIDGTSLYIPPNMELFLTNDNGEGPVSLTVIDGGDITNDGQIHIGYQGTLTIGQQGSYYYNMPILEDETAVFDYSEAEYISYNQDELENGIANTEPESEPYILRFPFTLERDLVIEENKSFVIGTGGSLTVPEGVTLYNGGHLGVDGGKLIVDGAYEDKGGSLVEAHYSDGGYRYHSSIQGLAMDRYIVEVKGNDEAMIREMMDMVADSPVKPQRLVIGLYWGELTLEKSLTIPEYADLNIWGNDREVTTLYVPKNVTLRNHGNINLGENGRLIVEGTYAGGLPGIEHETAEFQCSNLQGILAADLKQGGDVVLGMPLTLKENLTIPANARLILEGEYGQGSITIPNGKTLTVNGELILHSAQLLAETGGKLVQSGGQLILEADAEMIFPSGATLDQKNWAYMAIDHANVILEEGAILKQVKTSVDLVGGELDLGSSAVSGTWNADNSIWNNMQRDENGKAYFGGLYGEYNLGDTYIHGFAQNMDDVDLILDTHVGWGYDVGTVQIDDSGMNENGAFVIDRDIYLPPNAGIIVTPSDPGDEITDILVEVHDGASIFAMEENTSIQLGQNTLLDVVDGGIMVGKRDPELAQGGALIQYHFDWAEEGTPSEIWIHPDSQLILGDGGILWQRASGSRLINYGGEMNLEEGVYDEANSSADARIVNCYNNSDGIFGTVKGAPQNRLYGFAAVLEGDDISLILEESRKDIYSGMEIFLQDEKEIHQDVEIPAGTVMRLENNLTLYSEMTIRGGLIVSAGTKLDNEGLLNIFDEGYLIVEEGGSLNGNHPFVYGGQFQYEAFTEQMLRDMLASGQEEVLISAPVTITTNLVIPEGVRLRINNDCLTIQADASITNYGMIFCQQGGGIVSNGGKLFNGGEIKVLNGGRLDLGADRADNETYVGIKGGRVYEYTWNIEQTVVGGDVTGVPSSQLTLSVQGDDNDLLQQIINDHALLTKQYGTGPDLEINGTFTLKKNLDWVSGTLRIGEYGSLTVPKGIRLYVDSDVYVQGTLSLQSGASFQVLKAIRVDNVDNIQSEIPGDVVPQYIEGVEPEGVVLLTDTDLGILSQPIEMLVGEAQPYYAHVTGYVARIQTNEKGEYPAYFGTADDRSYELDLNGLRHSVFFTPTIPGEVVIEVSAYCGDTDFGVVREFRVPVDYATIDVTAKNYGFLDENGSYGLWSGGKMTLTPKLINGADGQPLTAQFDTDYVTERNGIYTITAPRGLTEPQDVTITFCSDDYTDPVTVNVVLRPTVTALNLAYEGQTVTGKTLTVDMNALEGDFCLDALVEPAAAELLNAVDAKGNALTQWTTDKKNIATVEEGKLSFHGETGKVKVTLTTNYGVKKTAAVTLNVVWLPTELYPSADVPEAMIGGGRTTLTAMTYHWDTSEELILKNTDVTWTLCDEAGAPIAKHDFATLTAKGVLSTKAVKEETTLYVMAQVIGNEVTTGPIPLTLYPAISSVRILDGTTDITKLTRPYDLKAEGTEHQMYWDVGEYPESVNPDSVTWTADKKVLADIGNNGALTLAEKASGKIKFTVTLEDLNGKKHTAFTYLDVGVLTYDLVITSDGVALEELADLRVFSGGSISFEAENLDFDGEPGVTKPGVTWSVSDKNLGSISAKGVFKPKTVTNPTDVEITATSADKAYSESFWLKVYPKLTAVNGEILESLFIQDESGEFITGTTVPMWAVAGENTMRVLPFIFGTEDYSGISWSSSNEAVARVDQNGCITALTVGTAVITAVDTDEPDRKSASFTVKVSKRSETVEITPENAVVAAGKSLDLLAEVTYSDGSTDSKVNWSLHEDAKGLATITNKGKLTAVRTITEAVTVSVYAHAQDGQSYGEIAVTLVPLATSVKIYEGNAEVTGMTINVDKRDLDDLTLSAEVDPGDANQNVNWKSSANNVAEVDKEGNVTIHKTGTVTITATAADGSNKKATVKLVITKSMEFVNLPWYEMLEVEGTSTKLLTVGGGKSLTFSKLDGYKIDTQATNRNLVWSMTYYGGDQNGENVGSNVATLRNGTLTTKAVDEVIPILVRAEAADGGCEPDECIVYIQPISTKVEIDSVDINNLPAAGQHDMARSSTFTLGAAVTPGAAQQAVIWTSSSVKIAEIDKNTGEVTCLKPGAVTFTATAADGSGKKDSVKITIVETLNAIVLPETLGVASGKSLKLADQLTTVNGSGERITLKESTASDKAITWKLVDGVNGVATLNEKTGELKAAANLKERSTVTVQASITNRPDVAAAECKVTVAPIATGVTILCADRDLTQKVDKRTADFFTLTADILPEKANQEVTWTSSNAKVAKIDPDTGYVSWDGETAGTVTFTATAKDGSGRKATVKVTFVTAMTSITLPEYATIFSSKNANLTKDPDYSFDKTASDKTINWKFVDEQGETVTYPGVATLKAGTVTIDRNLTQRQQLRVRAEAAANPDVYAECIVMAVPLTKGVEIRDAEGKVLTGTVNWPVNKPLTLVPDTTNNPVYGQKDDTIDEAISPVYHNWYVSLSTDTVADLHYFDPETGDEYTDRFVVVAEAGVDPASLIGKTVKITVKAIDGSNKSASVTIKFTAPLAAATIRDFPSITAGEVAELEYGTDVQIEGTACFEGVVWCYLNAPEKGWAMATDLSAIGVSELPAPEEELAVVTADTAYVYASPTETSLVRGTLYRGDPCRISRTDVINGKTWSWVSYPELLGWIPDSDIQMDELEKPEITLWTYPIGSWGDAETVNALLADFEADTGISISVEYLSYQDGDAKVAAAVEGGAAPDLILEGPERLVSLWGARGRMVNIADLFDSQDKAQINPMALDACFTNSTTAYQYPLTTMVHSMAINKTVFEAAGAMQYIDQENRTWTTENFWKAVEAVYEYTNQTVGAVYCGGQGGDQGTRALVTNLYGGSYTDAGHTEYTWNTGENVAALKALYENPAISFDPSLSGGNEMGLFFEGSLNMAFCWNYAQQKNPMGADMGAGKTIDGDEIMFLSFPSPNGTDAQLQGGVWGFGIFDNGDTARIEAAKEFIRYFCDSEATADAVRAAGYFPARSAAGTADLSNVWNQDPVMKDYQVLCSLLGDYYQVTPNWAEARTAWWNMLQEIGASSGTEAAIRSILQKYEDMANNVPPTAPAADISLWTYPVGAWSDEATVSAMMEEFYQDTGIRVDVTYLDYMTGDDRMAVAIAAAETPDLVLEAPERLVGSWGAGGFMVNLADMFDSTDRKQLYAGALDACFTDSTTAYQYPLTTMVHSMAINKTVFEAAGAMKYIDQENHTWTTENFWKAVEAVYEYTNQTVGAVYCGGQGGDQGTRALVNNLCGGTYTNAAHTAYTWNSQENISALKGLYDCAAIDFDPAIVGGDEIALFYNGLLNMAFCWNVAQQKNPNMAGTGAGRTADGDEIMVMSFPSPNGTDAQLQGGVWGFGIFNNGDAARIEAAKEFIRYFCDSEATVDAVRAAGYFPARSVAGTADLSNVWDQDPVMKDYQVLCPLMGDYYQVTPNWSAARTAWWNMLQKVGASNGTEGAIRNILAECDQSINNS